MRPSKLAFRYPAVAVAVAAAVATATSWAHAAGAGGAARGVRVYELYCATCHGAAGNGAGPTAARYGSPLPRDFTLGTYKFRSTASGKLPLRKDLVRTVSRGLKGTVMPAWQDVLSPADIDAVIRYVEEFSPRFAEVPESERGALDVPPAPASTQVSVARGGEVYRQMGCANCHGQKGYGDGPAAPSLRDDQARPIRPLDFTRGLYKGGSTPEDVYRTFVTGIDGTPMPSYGDSLPDEADRWALVHYVRSLSRPRGFFGALLGVHDP
jgi:cytochrome c oxidase cbb3-type subunit 2